MQLAGLKRLLSLFVISLILISAAVGCTGTKKSVEIMAPPPEPLTCSQVLADGVENYSSGQIAEVLDQAWLNTNEACWRKVVRASLEKGQDLPMHHLARAVHLFNHRRTETVFAKAVHAYFMGMVDGKAMYKEADQRLMKAWMGYEIRNARSKNDPGLVSAKQVCRRLDASLYERLFF